MYEQKKVSRKINALGWIANYMFLEKRCIVMKAFIESRFNYCPLIWIFHSRTINKKSTAYMKEPYGLSTLT